MTDQIEPLEQRFKRFVSGLAGAESLDDLPMTHVQKQAKKADFFFLNRSIIAEMKSLTTDVSPKAERIMEPHRERGDFPGFYGKWPIDAILARLPDGDEIRKQLYTEVTAGIADLVAEANRQIRKTKEVFDLPNAHGVLLIFNDSVAILDPRMIAHRAYGTLMKRTSDGQVRYPEIGAIWIVSETHRIKISEQLDGIPGVMMAHPLVPDDTAMEFLSELQKPWADFSGLPLVEMGSPSPETMEFSDTSRQGEHADGITLGEHWRRQYHDRPYLRDLTDNELVFYGARLSVEMTFIQNGPWATRFGNLRSTRRWADLNEELNQRHIDIRRVRHLAMEEGMHLRDESAEFWEQTKLLADDCDTLVER